MSTENIVNFLQTAYSDEKLAALLAHAQDGKLSYNSCCCLVGAPNSPHALIGMDHCIHTEPAAHLKQGRNLLYGAAAEEEFLELGRVEFGYSDEMRRENLIPLILAEMERRTWQRFAESLPDISLEEQHRLEEIDAESQSADLGGYQDPVYERNGR